MKTEKILPYIIETLLLYVEELKEVADCKEQQFLYGEKLAYVECLEMLALWEGAAECGLDFDVEERYPL